MITVLPTPATTLRASVITMNATDVILARRLMARCVRQPLIVGPSRGCVTSQSCKRGDDRAKANAASSMNGVVGMSGSTMPAMPQADESRPRVIQSARAGTDLYSSKKRGAGIRGISRGRTAAAAGPPVALGRGTAGRIGTFGKARFFQLCKKRIMCRCEAILSRHCGVSTQCPPSLLKHSTIA